MKSVKFRMIAIALLSAAMPFTAKAQDKVEASVGADFVSNYIWRGTDCGGVSIQPSMGVSYKGLSLTAWGFGRASSLSMPTEPQAVSDKPL